MTDAPAQIIEYVPAYVWGALTLLIYAVTELVKFILTTKREKAASDKIALALQEAEKKTAAHAQAQADSIKETLAAADRVKNHKLDVIHAQGNSMQETQLRLTAEALRKVADMQPSTENVASAEAAETLLQEHRDRQSIADKVEASILKENQR